MIKGFQYLMVEEKGKKTIESNNENREKRKKKMERDQNHAKRPGRKKIGKVVEKTARKL
jgi:hypothetical protein